MTLKTTLNNIYSINSKEVNDCWQLKSAPTLINTHKQPSALAPRAVAD